MTEDTSFIEKEVEHACDLALQGGDYIKKERWVDAAVNIATSMGIYEKYGLNEYYDMVRRILFSKVEQQIALEVEALAEEKCIPLDDITMTELREYTPTYSGMMTRLESQRKEYENKLLDLYSKK